jgi:hypothetical protein
MAFTLIKIECKWCKGEGKFPVSPWYAPICEFCEGDGVLYQEKPTRRRKQPETNSARHNRPAWETIHEYPRSEHHPETVDNFREEGIFERCSDCGGYMLNIDHCPECERWYYRVKPDCYRDVIPNSLLGSLNLWEDEIIKYNEEET